MSKKLDDILQRARRKEIVEGEGFFYEFEEDEPDEKFINSLRDTKLRVIKNYLGYPIIFLHELLHLIFGLITFSKIESFKISSPKFKNFHGFVSILPSSTNYFSTFLIAISPIFSLITFIILSFINPWFLIGLVYSLIFIKLSLPSKLDLMKILLYKYSKEFDDYDFDLFFDECYDNLDLKDMI